MQQQRRRSIDEEENVYGTDNKAFYIGQGRDPATVSLGGEHTQRQTQKKSKTRRCNCLLVGIRMQTWKNLAYNLFVNISYAGVTWSVFSALFMLSAILVPFCFVGVLVFVATLQIARFMAVAEIAIINAFSPPSNRAYRPSEQFDVDTGIKGWFIKVGGSLQSYKDFLYLWLLKLPVAFATCLITGILVGGSISLITAPIVFGTCETCMKDGNLCIGDGGGSWDNGTCDGWKIDSFGDSVGICLIGVVFLILSLHISNGLAWLSMGMGKWMCGIATGNDGSGRPLLADAHTSQMPTSAPVNYSAQRHPDVVVVVEGSKPTE